MNEKLQWHLRRVGLIAGAWLLGLYAMAAESVNRLALPDVPLVEPRGGLFLYLFGYLVVGALLGLLCCWTSSTLAGVAAGGAAGALAILGFNLVGAMDTPAWLGGMSIITFISFLPMALLLAPVAFLVRFTAEAFVSEPDAYQRRGVLRWWRPLAATLIFLAFGLSTLFPQHVRDALQETYDSVNIGLTGDVPTMLEPVWKFPSGADGTYTIEYSDSWQSFEGQYAASLDPLSAFLIKVRFSNGFVISCLYSSSSGPACLNEDFPFGE